MWETIEKKWFGNSLAKTLSAIWLLCGLQLGITILMAAVMFRASRLVASSVEAATAALNTGLGIALAAALMFIMATFGMVRGLRHLWLKPLVQVDSLFENLSRGQSDLSAEMAELPYAELSHVAGGYNIFIQRIRDIIDQVRA